MGAGLPDLFQICLEREKRSNEKIVNTHTAAQRESLTIVFRLSHFGKFKVFKVNFEFSTNTETEPSEKNNSICSHSQVLIVSHSLYIFQFLSVAIKINFSGL